MIESYGEQDYDRTTYYEKWIRAVRNLLVEQGMSDARGDRGQDGRGARRARQGRPQGRQGDASRGEQANRVKGASAPSPAAALRRASRCASPSGRCSGHCRTPWYLRGKPGVVAAVQGIFRNPEQLAYHKPGLPSAVLYKVRFEQGDLWGRYRGARRRSSRGRHLRALAGAGHVRSARRECTMT